MTDRRQKIKVCRGEAPSPPIFLDWFTEDCFLLGENKIHRYVMRLRKRKENLDCLDKECQGAYG
jgi:hypothetical protein